MVKRIVRCPATNVNPETAARDLEIPPTLSRNLGHMDCGIYAEVIADGEIGVGDTVAVEEPSWCEASGLRAFRHGVERSDEAVQRYFRGGIWIAFASLAMTSATPQFGITYA